MARRVVASLCLLSLAFAAPEAAICENKLSAFFVVDNRALDVPESLTYRDFSEEECQRACSTNRDPDGRNLMCASFSYDHKTFVCTLFKEKTVPAGKLSAIEVIGRRYFEKFCLAEDLPLRCGEAQFIRTDGHVLVGFAKNVTLVDTLEDCVAECVRDVQCKSAMFFYEEGECITNTESAITQPDAFKDEDDDKVVYFQNGCRPNPRKQSKRVKTTERPRPTTTTTEAPEETTTEFVESEEVQTAEPPSTDSPIEEPIVDDEDESSATALPHEEEEATAEYEASGLLVDDEEEVTTTEVPYEESDKLGSDEDEEFVPKKYEKHPKNYGAKTLTDIDEVLENRKHFKLLQQEAQDEEVQAEPAGESVFEDASATPFDGLLDQGDGLQRKHNLAIKPLKNKKQYQQSFFSEWSDWTECGPEGGRTIRRRKCLDLRKCIGGLTQVKPCPPQPEQVAPAAGSHEQQQPIGPSVKSVLPVPQDHDEFALGSPPSIEASSPAPPAEESKPGVWSPWLGVCQQFASGQPCNNHEMIGFESRECVAADPSECNGPFFRYCTLPC